MGGEKPVLLIGSPMCQTFCGVITTMMLDANRVSEAKYKKLRGAMRQVMQSQLR